MGGRGQGWCESGVVVVVGVGVGGGQGVVLLLDRGYWGGG